MLHSSILHFRTFSDFYFAHCGIVLLNQDLTFIAAIFLLMTLDKNAYKTWELFLKLIVEIFEAIWDIKGEEFFSVVSADLPFLSVQYFFLELLWNHLFPEILFHNVAWVWCLRLILNRWYQQRRKQGIIQES